MDRLTLKICRQQQYRKAILNSNSNFISIWLVIYSCVFTCLLFAPWRMYVYIINFNLSKWFSDLFKSNYKCLLLVYIYIHRVFPTLFQKKKKPDCNLYIYKDRHGWNLQKPVVTSISIGRNHYQPKKFHGLHEIILMTSDSNSHRIRLFYFLYLTDVLLTIISLIC